jgi:hypothetical protein
VVVTLDWPSPRPTAAAANRPPKAQRAERMRVLRRAESLSLATDMDVRVHPALPLECWTRRLVPESARAHDFAMVAAARLVIAVVPPVFGADRLAVSCLRGQAEVDQEPRQAAPNPCPPSIRVLRIPEHQIHLRMSGAVGSLVRDYTAGSGNKLKPFRFDYECAAIHFK